MLEETPPTSLERLSEDVPPVCRRDAINRVLEAEQLAVAGDSDGGLESEVPSSQRRPESCILNEAGYIESVLTAEEEPLPQNHPLTKWLYETFEEMYPDEENVVIYLTAKQSVDAFCLANGSIFLSRGLVELCDSKEALQFVLSHEYNHFRRGHFTYNADFYKGVFAKIGEGRVHEYEGDLGAVADMEETGINPYGAMEFFRRMMQFSKGSKRVQFDLDHGNLEDRLLNVETVLHIKDSKELNKNLTVFPEAIRQALTEVSQGSVGALGCRENLIRDLKLIPDFSFGQLVSYFERLRRLYVDCASEFERQSLIDCYKAGLERLKKLIRIQGVCADVRECEFSASLLAQLATTLSLARTPSVIPDQFHPARLVREPDDLKTLTAVLKPEYFAGLGAYCVADPLNFAEELFKQLLEQGQFQKNGRFNKKAYSSFVKELSDALQALYEERGTEVIKFGPTWHTTLTKLTAPYRDTKKKKKNEIAPDKAPKSAKTGLRLSVIAPRLITDANSSAIRQLDLIANGKLTDTEISAWLKGRSKAEIESDLTVCNRLASSILEDSGVQRAREEMKCREPGNAERKDGEPLHRYGDQLFEFLNKFNLQVLNELKQQGHFSNLKEMFGFFEKTGCRRIFDQNKDYAEYESNPLIERAYRNPKTAVFLPGSFEEMCEVYGAHFSASRVGPLDMKTVSNIPTEVWWHVVTAPLLCRNDVTDKTKLTQKITTLTRVNPDFLGFYKERHDEGNIERINTFLGKIFKAHSLDLAHSPADARLLFYTSFLMHAPYLASMSQSIALRALVATMDFDGGHEFFFEEQKKPVYAFEAINSFIESRVNTHGQFERIRTSTEAKLKDGLDHERIGKMALADSFIDMLGTQISRMDFYRACSMSESDLELKTLIALVRAYYVEIDGFDFNTDSERVPSPLLYRSLMTADDNFKYFLVRKLLVGPKGILMDGGDRVTFLNQLLEGEVQAPQNGQDKKILDFLKKMLEQVAGVAEFDQLYFMLAPLMMRRLLIPPKKRASWEDALWLATEEMEPKWAEYEIGEFMGSDMEINAVDWAMDGWKKDPRARLFAKALPDLEAKGALTHYKTSDAFSLIRCRGYNDEEYENAYIWDEPIKMDAGTELYAKFLYIINNYSGLLYRICPTIAERIKKDAKILAKNEGGGRDAASYANPVMQIIEESAHRVQKNKLNVFDFVLEVAQNLGSPGIRFLQLLGQYVDLPPQLEASISQVYDKVHGQNKLAAYYLVEREWPEFKEQVAEMRASVGGGSLMTVYEALMKNGERRILKVLNPNAEEKNKEIYQLMYKAFEAMGPEYADALPLIEEIQAWISHDIKFENHLEEDRKFREKNHGFTDGSGYTIGVPQSFEPESRYFKMEEFVDGKNLTDLEGLKQDGHDPKKIVSLIARNYMHQLQGGLVHSDVHPGNFRITADKQVAILDRNFALEYSPDEIARISSLVLSMDDSNTYLVGLIDLFVGEESDADKDYLHQSVSGAIQDVDDSLERTKRVILTLKKKGIKLPLKLTLLFKNIFALNHLAKKVGYSGVMEAVLG